MKKLRRNKKGSFQDLILVMILLIFFSIVVLVANKVMDELNTQFQADDNIDARGKAASAQLLSYYSGVVDNTFLFFVVGIAMVVLVLAALVRIHPIFVPFFFIGWVILIFVSGVISNIYQEMAAQPQFLTIANQLTFITNVLTYLPIFIAVIGIALMVVMYKQWQISQQF